MVNSLVTVDQVPMRTKYRIYQWNFIMDAIVLNLFFTRSFYISLHFLGKENKQESNDDKSAILNCCTILTDQGYPVVSYY